MMSISPLSSAIQHDHINAIVLLLEYGATVGNDELYRAAKNHNDIVIAITPLIKHGYNINSIAIGCGYEYYSNKTKTEDYTALHIAVCKGSVNMVRELLNNGADRTIRDKCGNTPLDIATNAIKHIEEMKEVIALLDH